tara:strand:- start:466 stop:1263 length:798 start_codon:yes stop_codon:yes gene_type:complete
MSEIRADKLHNVTGDNDSGIDLSTNDVVAIDIAGSEKARMDSNGDLLIGKTSSSFDSSGIEFKGSNDTSFFTRSGTPMFLNRLSSDGDHIEFYKDGSSIGSIGTANSGDIFIGNDDVSLMMAGGSDAVIPRGTAGATRDNAVSLGVSSNRFDDAFITNGVTTGSDRNLKQDIEELTDAEQRVAVVCKGLMRKFRWKDAVAEKGDKARIHFGIIAQDLQDAFTAEGLDASKYAMFCSDTWIDDDGKDQTRLSVRYSELLAFIISAI